MRRSDSRYSKKIVRYAGRKKLLALIVLAVIFILWAGLCASYRYINNSLIQANKTTVEKLVKAIEDSSIVSKKIERISKRKRTIESQIKALNERIKNIEEERNSRAKKTESREPGNSQKIQWSGAGIEKLTREKMGLENKSKFLQKKENAVLEILSHIDKRKIDLEKESFDTMYNWITLRQNPRTGLVMSGDVSAWAFIYDQSMSAQSYMLFSDFERARKVLDFFLKKAKRSPEKLFYNAYFVNDGNPAEYVFDSEPNIWLGITALHYADKTKEKNYIHFAEGIAQALLNLMTQDKKYSTECNLDAYAFFAMLHKITGKELYLNAGEKIVDRLVTRTYDKTVIPRLRPKGASLIVTDTYAQSIVSLGAEKLEKLGIDPDKILESAEQNCAVEINYARPEGRVVKIKGFNFAPEKYASRKRTVSLLRTAQMVLSFKTMADFYYKKEMNAKAKLYDKKAETFLRSLDKMTISSLLPAEQGDSYLPYAIHENKRTQTGSVIAAAYALFAYYNYNPLRFNDE